MKSKVCCIFNLAPHYRAPIYKIMDRELGCDFYFGDKVRTPIKTMEYTQLKGFQRILKNVYIPRTGFEWQKGAWPLVFKPYKYYIITGTPGSLSNWVLLLWAKVLRKQVFAWSHGMKGDASKMGYIIAKNFYRLCTKVLLYGDYSKNNMIKEGFNPNKLIPIYNSLDYDAQLKVREKLNKSTIYLDYFQNSAPVLIYIGRIQKSKKLDILIDALKQFQKKNVIYNLIVVGDDIDGNDIPSMVETYGLQQQVWFYGPCYEEEEIGNLIYNADVCISPGLIGLTAIHALTYGTPVITSDSFSKHGPEFEAVTEGVTGDFFKTDNLQDLCSKISSWINLTPIKRNQVRMDAYKTIEKKYNAHYQIKVLKSLVFK